MMLPEKWDRETDVIVVGTGFAGLAAAIEAHDAGVSVIVLEKMATPGGNSIIASGGVNAVDPKRQIAQGIKDSVDLHFKHTFEGGNHASISFRALRACSPTGPSGRRSKAADR